MPGSIGIEETDIVALQLPRILEDARFIEERLDSLIAQTDEDLERFQYAQDVLGGGRLEDDGDREKFAFAIVDSYRMDEVDLSLPGLEQLVESGDLQLISNTETQEVLLSLINYRRSQDMVITHLRQLFDHLATVVMTKTTFSIEPENSNHEAGANYRLIYDLAELQNDVNFKRAIGNLGMLHGYLRIRLVGYNERVARIIEVLETNKP